MHLTAQTKETYFRPNKSNLKPTLEASVGTASQSATAPLEYRKDPFPWQKFVPKSWKQHGKVLMLALLGGRATLTPLPSSGGTNEASFHFQLAWLAYFACLLACFASFPCLEPSLLISIFLTKNTIPSAHVKKQAIFGLKLGN